MACLPVGAARADSDPDSDPRLAIHGQATWVEQETNSFHAPYRGPNSLTPDSGRETVDATLYLGLRPWAGGELWIAPELDQGFGLDDTLGVAGFPSAEAYKIGRNQPYLRLQRAYLRQTVNTGAATESVDGTANQMAGRRSPDRWVITLGKFSVTDVFDVNQYAHDPRADFLNWTAVDVGTFDYAADAWGYSVGASLEWYRGAWTLRGGAFDLSDVPNSARLEPGFDEFELLAEAERRHEIAGHSGKLLLTTWLNRGRMARLDEAVAAAAASGGVPEVATVRRYGSRAGASINFEQELAEGVGLFGRAGKAGGNVEVYEFADVDRAIQLGLSVKGGRWRRPQDSIGIAALVNGISAARENYLNAGGLGLVIGDGRLPHPGSERIVESYYSFAVCSYLTVSGDFQYVVNPAYNRDRGPASIFALRVHMQF